jgi:O-acetyl-ADP-ribose deacetylase (regulator of RNase III)
MNEVIFHLRDLDASLVEAWTKYFGGCPAIRPSAGDVFGIEADAIVSPANSFGFMDGGIDLLYSRRFGWQLQERLQDCLRRDYDGELPVGMAVLLGTGDPQIPYLISAPTMRAPASVRDTLNAYLAFRAALRTIQKHNAQFPGTIRSVICPGLGTATGEMPAELCAKQMHAAYAQVVEGRPRDSSSINSIINEHYRLLREAD